MNRLLYRVGKSKDNVVRGVPWLGTRTLKNSYETEERRSAGGYKRPQL